MVAQQKQERLAGGKLAGTPDSMAVTLRLGLDREAKALLKIEQTAGLFLGPFHSLESRPQVSSVVAEMIAIDGLVAGRANDADLFDSTFERLLGNDLEDRLGQAIPIDNRQHRLLHRVRCRILPRPPSRRSNDRLGNLHVAWPLLPRRSACRNLSGERYSVATPRCT